MYSDIFNFDIVDINLRQLDPLEICNIDGIHYYCEFPINDKYKVAYSFDINSLHSLSLHRVLPFRFFHGHIEKETELVDFIKKDVNRFREAAQSDQFDDYIKVMNRLQSLGETMDDLFLNYSTNPDMMKNLVEKFSAIDENLSEILSSAEKSEAL